MSGDAPQNKAGSSKRQPRPALFLRLFPKMNKRPKSLIYSVRSILRKSMQLIDNIPVWGPPDQGALSQIKTCAKTADKVALMADHHKGYAVPIGGVGAYKNSSSPTGVGFDIFPGNKPPLFWTPAASR